MDLSALLIRVIFLLLPGALASTLYRQLRGGAKRKDWQDLLEIVILSLPSYAFYGLIVHLVNSRWAAGLDFTAFDAFFNEKVPIRWQDVLNSSIVGILLAVLAAYAYRFNVVNRMGKAIGATTRFGDEDVWDFFHHSPNVRGSWVTVRDHKTNLYYFGWIEAFSDSGVERELLLREVSVHDNFTGECIYKTEVVYLSRKPDDLTLEAATLTDESSKNESKDKVEEKPAGERQVTSGE